MLCGPNKMMNVKWLCLGSNHPPVKSVKRMTCQFSSLPCALSRCRNASSMHFYLNPSLWGLLQSPKSKLLLDKKMVSVSAHRTHPVQSTASLSSVPTPSLWALIQIEFLLTLIGPHSTSASFIKKSSVVHLLALEKVQWTQCLYSQSLQPVEATDNQLKGK